MQIRRAQSGLTMLELMIGLGIVAILAGLVGPSFRDLMLSSQITSATNNLISALAYARSEAVKRSVIVRVDAIGGDWDNGWQVVNDADNAVIRNFDAPAGTVDIVEDDGTFSLRFDGRGLMLGQADGTVMTVCHAGFKGRQIALSATGRPHLNREFNGC